MAGHLDQKGLVKKDLFTLFFLKLTLQGFLSNEHNIYFIFYLVKPQPVAKMLRHSNEKPAFLYLKSLLVVRLWYTILTGPPPPPSLPFYSKLFHQVWSCIASNVDKGRRGGITSTRSWTGHLSKNEGQCLKCFCNWLQLYRKKKKASIDYSAQQDCITISVYFLFYFIVKELISTHMIKVFRGWY